MEDFGQGVHVVTVDDNEGKYILNVEELEKILLRPEVRDQPVVLVSVAGVYRGGKSFLLDFLLRYLYSQEDDRSTGRWLGDNEEPLKGFSWCSGSERHTTGLMLWSQPIPMVLPSGQKVIVLLMDTQGTFDHHSTMRDCSTIFALSTLLSSVQIYNIKENIKADDLQHLQLFTHYGKMVATNGRKTFQTLQFLVRDWPYPHEHAYGANGGEELLHKRLSVADRQNVELQEIRQYVRSCFDNIGCFLLPHPGWEVCKPNFKGFLTDLKREFKDSLLEFAPMILQPENLKIKKIDGKSITAVELCNYFKIYMKIFNSDELPAPKTIVKATAEAGLLCAMENCRRQYDTEMQLDCNISLSNDELENLHVSAMNSALETFTNTKIMCAQKLHDTYFTQLVEDLKSRLQQYHLVNVANTQKIVANAKNEYEKEFKTLCEGDHLLCVIPQDLSNIHDRSMENALNVLNVHRKSVEGLEDKERSTFINDIEKRFKEFCAINELNNNAAVSEARLEYLTFMENICGSQPCMNALEMESKHQDALSRALELFMSKRNRHSEYPVDSYKSELTKVIDEQFGKFQTLNCNNNKRAIEAAISYYDKYMGSICNQFLPCLHPNDLNQEHDDTKDRALNEFYSNRRFGDNVDVNDEHTQTLIQALHSRYENLCEMNNRNNSLAADAALREYCSAMEALCGRGCTRISCEALTVAHERNNNSALDFFKRKRRPYEDHQIDSFQTRLIENIEQHLRHYRDLNANNPEAAEETEGSLPVETALVAIGATALAAGAIVATSGLGIAAAAGTALTAENVAVMATTAAGVAATTVAAILRSAKNVFRRRRE